MHAEQERWMFIAAEHCLQWEPQASSSRLAQNNLVYKSYGQPQRLAKLQGEVQDHLCKT